jgi:hypothetical protein
MIQLSCAEFVEGAGDLLDGTAPAAYRDHVRDCPGCERYLDQLVRTVRGLGDLPAERLPGAVRERLRGAFAAARPPGPDPRLST